MPAQSFAAAWRAKWSSSGCLPVTTRNRSARLYRRLRAAAPLSHRPAIGQAPPRRSSASSSRQKSVAKRQRGRALARAGSVVYIIHVPVRITPEAEAEFGRLPIVLRIRVEAIFGRLARWPSVSGAKPLSGSLAGSFRIRTGDWRVVFRPQGADVVVVRIQHRSEVYER